MHSHPFHRLALTVIVLAGLAAAVMLGAKASGFEFTLWLATGALTLSALLVAGLVWLHDVVRTALWNAGRRVR